MNGEPKRITTEEVKLIGKALVEVDMYEVHGVEWIRQSENPDFYYHAPYVYDDREPDWSEMCTLGNGGFKDGEENILAAMDGYCKTKYKDVVLNGGLVEFDEPKTVKYYVERLGGTYHRVWIEVDD